MERLLLFQTHSIFEPEDIKFLISQMRKARPGSCVYSQEVPKTKLDLKSHHGQSVMTSTKEKYCLGKTHKKIKFTLGNTNKKLNDKVSLSLKD